jgi:mannose-6-phosphate isomerase-like protein (cupin superfamily)
VIKKIIFPERSTSLRKNDSQELRISFKKNNTKKVYIINGSTFNTENNLSSITYNRDISNHQIIYDPYKYEDSEKLHFKAEFFIRNYRIPKGYINTLPKWYSFKFTYPDHNLIFIRPEYGLSIQIHKYRNELWEILDGNPIILNGNTVYYNVKSGTKFKIPTNTFHTVINPNKKKFVILKEQWSGTFNEEDISRVFNPNNYT